jgi:glycerol kinase
VFDLEGHEIARHQLEHQQLLPGPGLVEHDPLEIAARVADTVSGALSSAGLTGHNLAAVGVTNQRETIVVWNPRTGQPWHNAIVWQDTRTHQAAKQLDAQSAWLRERTGLPPSTYFSALKLQWLLKHVDGLRDAAHRGNAVAGTIDTWVIWNLTGGPDGGQHVTDVTNASRTQLMNLRTRDWDDELLTLFDIPRRMLPLILPSSSVSAYGTTRANGPAGAEVPITGCLGDQHAALVGQACFKTGMVKNTYGTGNFLLLNTGEQLVPSESGLLTTFGYVLEPSRPVYALEGSIAVTGAAVQWLRDQLGIIQSASEIEALATTVPDSGGIYFVPAFSGLFAPYWRPDARGVIAGLSRFHTRAHLARATLEAIAFQTRAVLEVMVADASVPLDDLKVDGGATANNLLMQLQADILGVSVVRPETIETTALGAAYAAGLGVGIWKTQSDLERQWRIGQRWEPAWSVDQRDQAYRGWQKAVERSLNWLETS